MKLKDLILKMSADEKLRVKSPNTIWWLDCTPDTLTNDPECESLLEKDVSQIWYGTVSERICVELE